MTITNGYATLAAYKTWGKITSTDATDDTVIESIIEGVSRYIDSRTGRTFYARTETRYYDVPADRGRSLMLDDDLLTVTTLTNGDSDTIAATEYHLLPKNITPKREIRLTKTTTEYWDTDSEGDDEWVISVAGTWGYASATPHDIREACYLITQSFYKRRFGENISSSVKVTGAGVVITPQDVPSAAADILNRYRKLI
jgi:hypothetical protein